MKRQPLAEDLGIHLSSKKEEELFRWFLACLLFGKPIQREIAERALATFTAVGLLSPDAILRAGWDELVRRLDEAHYVRYDFSTATKLLHVCKELKELWNAHPSSRPVANSPGAFPEAAGLQVHRSGNRANLPARDPSGLVSGRQVGEKKVTPTRPAPAGESAGRGPQLQCHPNGRDSLGYNERGAKLRV
jgi:hypothetical protein